MLPVLLVRKAVTFRNTLLGLRGWRLAKNLMFSGAGLMMLAALYAGF